MTGALARWSAFLQVSDNESRFSFMLQLCGHDSSHALAHRSLGRNRLCLGSIVLVPDEAFSSGRRRLPLGVTSDASPARQTKSLRYAARTVSADRRAAGTSLCSLTA